MQPTLTDGTFRRAPDPCRRVRARAPLRPGKHPPRTASGPRASSDLYLRTFTHTVPYSTVQYTTTRVHEDETSPRTRTRAVILCIAMYDYV